jgi:hypothetical protein
MLGCAGEFVTGIGPGTLPSINVELREKLDMYANIVFLLTCRVSPPPPPPPAAAAAARAPAQRHANLRSLRAGEKASREKG